MWYKINFTDNLIYVRNLQEDEKVLVTISLISSCSTTEKTIVQNVEVDLEETFKLPLIDGKYKILLKRVSVPFNIVIETMEYIYPCYNLLLKSFIEDFEELLCGCSCNSCDDCKKDEKSSLSLMLKAMVHYTLLYNYYPKFYDAVFRCLNCSLEDLNNCALLQEKVLGNFNNEEIFEKIVISLYLSFYYAEYYNADTDAKKLVINNKFKVEKILKCIRKLNYNTDCIIQTIENNMGQFEIIFNAHINRPPSQVGDYSTTVENQDVLVLTPAMFTTLTVPVYVDPENDPAQAIRVDSLPTSGAVLKVGTAPVTVGQIITIATIASGIVTITGPSVPTLETCVFNFSVRDTGSMQFST